MSSAILNLDIVNSKVRLPFFPTLPLAKTCFFWSWNGGHKQGSVWLSQLPSSLIPPAMITCLPTWRVSGKEGKKEQKVLLSLVLTWVPGSQPGGLPLICNSWEVGGIFCPSNWFSSGATLIGSLLHPSRFCGPTVQMAGSFPPAGPIQSLRLSGHAY